MQSVEFGAALKDFHRGPIVECCMLQTVAQNSRTETLNAKNMCAKQLLVRVNHVISFA